MAARQVIVDLKPQLTIFYMTNLGHKREYETLRLLV